MLHKGAETLRRRRIAMFAPPISQQIARAQRAPAPAASCVQEGDGGTTLYVPTDPTKTAATQRTSPRAESGIERRRTEEERAEAFFPLRATTTAADPKRPGSCAAVLDERTSRHAFRL